MQAPKKIAVAGATGRVGRHAVDVLAARGHNVVPMSRASGVDVITGEGLAAALTGVECVIDAATGPSPEQDAATAFFTTAARNLHEAGERAGVRRMVTISIIGTDRFAGGYNAAKAVQERAMMAGTVPVRVLRAAQFHEFVEVLMEWGIQGDTAYVPGMRTQLVAARTVAEAAVDLLLEPEPWQPSGTDGAPFLEIAGPREERLAEAARLVADRRGRPLRVEEVVDPSSPDAMLWMEGAVLPGPHATLAGPTFTEWLSTVA